MFLSVPGMSANPSAFKSSLHYPNMSSSSSSLLFYIHCLKSNPSSFIFTAFNTVRIFVLLPLCIYILKHGLQQWKHTYHLVFMEIIDIIACILSFTGIYSDYSEILTTGMFLTSFVRNGEIFFHILTCVERYLAVVHPITYLKLKNKRGIKIRTILTGCVWLLCFVGMGLVMVDNSVIVFDF